MSFLNFFISYFSLWASVLAGSLTTILLWSKRLIEIKSLNLKIKNNKSGNLLRLLCHDIEAHSRLKVEIVFREYLGVFISFDEILLLYKSKFPLINFQSYKYAKQYLSFDGKNVFYYKRNISLKVRKVVANLVFGFCPAGFLFAILFLAAAIITKAGFEYIFTGIVGVVSAISLFIWSSGEIRNTASVERLLEQFSLEADCDPKSCVNT